MPARTPHVSVLQDNAAPGLNPGPAGQEVLPYTDGLYEYGRIATLDNKLKGAGIAPDVISRIMEGGETIRRGTAPERKRTGCGGPCRPFPAGARRPVFFWCLSPKPIERAGRLRAGWRSPVAARPYLPGAYSLSSQTRCPLS